MKMNRNYHLVVLLVPDGILSVQPTKIVAGDRDMALNAHEYRKSHKGEKSVVERIPPSRAGYPRLPNMHCYLVKSTSKLREWADAQENYNVR